MFKKAFVVFIFVFSFNFIAADTYQVFFDNNTISPEDKAALSLFDIVSFSKNSKGLTYILNLTSQEALQLRLLYSLDPFEFKVNGNKDSYSDLSQINERIDSISTDYSEISDVFIIGNSVEGREIKALRITGASKSDTPEILFVGLHHAREWISYEVPLSIAEFIVKNHSSNSYIQEILDNSVLWFVPMLNPDGYVYSWEEDRMWRLNRRVHPNSTVGVDLNRNYDSSWIKVEYYHGEEPFSEPETRAVRNLIENNVDSIPESTGIQNLDGLITYHSFGQLILYPPGSTNDPPEELALYEDLSSGMSGHIFSQCGSNYLVMQISSLYNTYGEMTEWFMINNDNKPAFTYELRPQMGNDAGFDLSADQINDTVKENIPPAFYFISSIIKGTADINLDIDDSGVVDFIQDTEYEYECRRDDLPEDDTDTADEDVLNDEAQQVADTENQDDEVDDNNEPGKIPEEISDEDVQKSSGCSLTKLL